MARATPLNEVVVAPTNEIEEKSKSSHHPSCCTGLLRLLPCALMCNSRNHHEGSRDKKKSEESMFYCSLCEVGVFKYSKHCRVCNKCVYHFDHHCRWVNNYIGKKYYMKFFTLVVFALLLVSSSFSSLINVVKFKLQFVSFELYDPTFFLKLSGSMCHVAIPSYCNIHLILPISRNLETTMKAFFFFFLPVFFLRFKHQFLLNLCSDTPHSHEIAAHSLVAYWNPCNDLLFSGAKVVLQGDNFQTGEEIFFSSCYRSGGFLHHFGHDCYLTTGASILLSHTNYKSTYDYIIALREQEQQLVRGQQTPQMSHVSSITGLGSASSFNTFHRGVWCTPPHLFLEDQFDVIPPDTNRPVGSLGKRMVGEQPIRKKNPGAININPWTLARLNADEASKLAAEAKKKSKILQPVGIRETTSGLETYSGFIGSGRMAPRPEKVRQM